MPEWAPPAPRSPLPAALLLPERAASLVARDAHAEAAPASWTWLRVVVGAVLAAVLLRAVVFEAYRIPSESMENTLLVGDFVFVSKLAYGAMILGHRLPGLDRPRRGDVVVFHYPPGLEPRVEDRAPYIKRLVGLPGDTVAVRAKQVRVNGAPVVAPPLGRRFWRIETDGPPPSSEALAGATLERLGPGQWLLDGTPDDAARVAALDGVVSISPYLRPPGDGSASFPVSERYSLDDYGPVVVPRRGLTVRLTDRTVGLYRVAIGRDEGHRLEIGATGVLLDGRPARRTRSRRTTTSSSATTATTRPTAASGASCRPATSSDAPSACTCPGMPRRAGCGGSGWGGLWSNDDRGGAI